ncbi:MAG: hypothetical protein ACLS48_04240 [[Eubacterium] siraeum]
MSKTVLFVASVTKKHIIQFHLPYMKWFKEHGCKVHVCAGDDFEPENKTYTYCDEYYIVPFTVRRLQRRISAHIRNYAS